MAVLSAFFTPCVCTFPGLDPAGRFLWTLPAFRIAARALQLWRRSALRWTIRKSLVWLDLSSLAVSLHARTPTHTHTHHHLEKNHSAFPLFPLSFFQPPE